MTIVGALVLFILLWWIAFFLTLPFGVHPTTEVAPGHDHGAPARPRLWTKAAIAAAIALAMLALFWVIQDSGMVTLRG